MGSWPTRNPGAQKKLTMPRPARADYLAKPEPLVVGHSGHARSSTPFRANPPSIDDKVLCGPTVRLRIVFERSGVRASDHSAERILCIDHAGNDEGATFAIYSGLKASRKIGTARGLEALGNEFLRHIDGIRFAIPATGSRPSLLRGSSRCLSDTYHHDEKRREQEKRYNCHCPAGPNWRRRFHLLFRVLHNPPHPADTFLHSAGRGAFINPSEDRRGLADPCSRERDRICAPHELAPENVTGKA